MLPIILTGTLPPPTGPFPVSYFSARHLPHFPYLVPAPTFSSTNTPHKQQGKQVFGVREVGWGVFYPAEVVEETKGWWRLGMGKAYGGVAWLLRPFHETLEGYQRFTGNHTVVRGAYPILRILGGRLRIPITPFLSPSSSNACSSLGVSTSTSNSSSSTTLTTTSTTSSKLPLIIFSHGLAGNHTSYSHYCAELASEGYVVVMVGHRDGSGPFYEVSGGRRRGVGEGEEGIKLFYAKTEDLDWSPKPTPSSPTALRSLQLDQRLAEIYEVYHNFRALVEDGHTGLKGAVLDMDDGAPPHPHKVGHKIDGQEDPSALSTFLDSWKDKVDVDDVTLIGHSFGGGTLLHLLQSPPPSTFLPIPVKRAIALDPWIEPLPLPAPQSAEQEKSDVKLLVINSDGFTVWRSHFGRVVELVKKSGGALVSIVGCDHQAFSDFPLLINATSSLKLLSTMHELSFSFLRGRLSSSPLVEGKVPDGGHIKTRLDGKKERLDGEWGEVVVHLVEEKGL